MDQLIHQHHLRIVCTTLEEAQVILEQSKMTEIIKSTLRIVCTTLEEY